METVRKKIRTRSIIREKVKAAYDDFFIDGDVTKLVRAVANIADSSIHCATHAGIMYAAIDSQPHVRLGRKKTNEIKVMLKRGKQ